MEINKTEWLLTLRHPETVLKNMQGWLIERGHLKVWTPTFSWASSYAVRINKANSENVKTMECAV
jgi:hypothetical protein